MTNPALARLGLPPDTKVLIIHHDDLGMCHAANAAFAAIHALAPAACGAVMMPAPWAGELIAWAKAHPAADVGVHLTLNSEWANLRWGPLRPADPDGGLLDGERRFWRSARELRTHRRPQAALAEMRTQLELALAQGLDVTHLDAHMGADEDPALTLGVIELAVEFRLPVFIPRRAPAGWEALGFTPAQAVAVTSRMADLEASGRALFVDRLLGTGGPLAARRVQWRGFVTGLAPGINHLYHHAALPGEEVRAMAPGWEGRVSDTEIFTDPAEWAWLGEQDVHVLGYRTLRDALRTR
ncbi:MAG TPA: ChbG/HpnK family deacetylase [Limnochordia bacterium]|nr:ChbG/HpnK family deacetylase [Limnochordia bacterium]